MTANLPTTPRTERRRLNAKHADQVAVALRPTLGRLLRRLEAIGFIPGERLYDLANTHRLVCGSSRRAAGG